MAVSREDVLHVARLARLRLSEEEIARFTHQLNDILAHVEELAEIGQRTGASSQQAGEAQSHADMSAATTLRPDVPGADVLDRSAAGVAVSWADGFFSVPRLPALDADASAADEP